MLTVALMAIATTASAQFANSGKSGGAVADTENYDRFYVGYSPVTIDAGGIDLKLSGLTAGWSRGFNVWKEKPLFVEVGANLMYVFGKEGGASYSYGDYNVEVIDCKYSWLAVNVPVVASWHFAVHDQIKLAPYAGLNMRGNIFGKEKSDDSRVSDYELDFFDSDEGDGKRFNVGLSLGLNVDYDNRYTFGIGYTTDFTEIMKNCEVSYWTISLGMKF